jgi:hypothetical protein
MASTILTQQLVALLHVVNIVVGILATQAPEAALSVVRKT